MLKTKRMPEIYKIRVPYLITYDFVMFGVAVGHTKRVTSYENSEIELVNEILRSHQHDAGTVQNIRVKKLN